MGKCFDEIIGTAGWNSANTGSIPRGCVYWRTSWPSTDKAVLLLFARFATVHAWDARIQSVNHKELSAALILLEQYYNIILNLWQQELPSVLLKQGKLTSTHFLRASDHLNYFNPLTTTQVILIWLLILTRLASSAELEWSLCSFCLPPLLWRQPPGNIFFSCDVYLRKHFAQKYLSFCDKR